MHQERECLFSLLMFLLLQISAFYDTIAQNQPLKDGEVLVSSGGYFALGFFSPRNSSANRYVGIWYNKVSEPTVVWVANRDNPIIDSSGVLSIDKARNLVLTHKNQEVLWSTNASSTTITISSSAQLMDSGNLVLFQGGVKKVVAWQSFDYPTNTMLPNMKLGLDRRTGLTRFLTSWKSGNDPGTGEYSYRMDPVGSPQFFLTKGSVRLWRTGPWNGIRWSGVPEMTPNFIFSISYVDNHDEITMMYGLHNASIFSRMVVNESGTVQRLTWHEADRRWVAFWSAPADQCDNFRHCGAFGDCYPYTKAGEFECTCLPGFEPKSARDWYLRDGSNGCVRKRGGSACGNGAGFVKVPRVKVPDTSIATRVDESLGAKACEELCLRNCSCSGYTAANVSGAGSGCITWHGDIIDTRQFANGGQDLFIRVDSIELGMPYLREVAKYAKVSRSFSGKRVVAVVVASVASLFFILCLVYILVKKRRGRKRQDELLFSPNTTSTTLGASPEGKRNDETGTNSDLPFYSLSIIAAATENFSIANKLGEGGFGLVYKGRLRNGQEIAVKRLSKSSGQGVEEFKNEVTLIAKLQHRNLVRLLGCCIEKEEKMLIYEYMPNKGLDSFIFDKEKGSLVDWRKRFEITLGIARGMLYLHQDSRLRIIHRDLKASNVLLDAAMNPKISDFGMARIFGRDQIQANTNRVVGTYGYMSPEYAMEGLFSTKSDVFSFGVLLLEIIIGRKNSSYYKENSVNLIGHVWDLWGEGRALEVADPSLGESYQAHEVLRCIHIGLLCVQEFANDRPSMSEVAFMLCHETALSSPTQPAFIFKKANAGADSSSASIGDAYGNEQRRLHGFGHASQKTLREKDEMGESRERLHGFGDEQRRPQRDNPITDNSGVLSIDKAGILILIHKNQEVIWSTNASSTTITISSSAQLVDSGNLVLFQVPKVEGMDYRGSEQPNMSDLSLVLADDGSTLVLQLRQGPPEFVHRVRYLAQAVTQRAHLALVARAKGGEVRNQVLLAGVTLVQSSIGILELQIMHHERECLFSLLTFLLLQISASYDTITQNQPLKDGEVLVSSGGYFALGFFSLSNSSANRYVGIWYNQVSEFTVVWVANRDNPITDSSGVLSIDKAGNLVLNHKNQEVLWSTNASSTTITISSSAQLVDSGNLVLFQGGGKKVVAWQSFDYPTNTMLPNMTLGLDRRTGQTRFLTSWKSRNDPGTGEYSLKMDGTGSAQFFLYRDSDRLWRSGPWNGITWSGIPILTSNLVFSVSYVDNPDEVTVIYGMYNASNFMRMVVSELGTVRRLVWNEGKRRWDEFWSVPEDQCDNFGHCGVFGDCDTYTREGEFECTCLPGFEPKLAHDWYLRDGSNGCVRKRGGRACGNGAGFVKVPHVKVPDTSTATRVDVNLGAKACEELCLSNCSCSGYSAANVSGAASGCITWHGDMIDTRQYTNGGQDLFIRVDSIELAKYAKMSRSFSGKRVVAVVVASVAALFFILCLVYMLVKKRRGKYSISQRTIIRWSKAEIRKIGRLRNEQEIAVKRLSNSSGQGVEEFKNEVTLIAKLQHRNLVGLLGCCIEKEEKILIYEYMPNKGLDSFIFDKEKGTLVDWRKRFEITLGIARGMLYLHQDSRLRIIHRDLKASNVLLDAAMNPKISDFGMARIFGGDQIEANTNRLVGTYGYMSPEYAMEGLFSTKSDVFSFGVLLLEIISGRKNSSYSSYDTITQNQPLKDGEVLVSSGGFFALGFFSPTNSSTNRYVGIWYNKVSEQTVVWVANRDDPIADNSGVLSIDETGNLVLNQKNQEVLWSTNGSSTTIAISSSAQLVDSGNFLLYQGGGKKVVAWQSFDYPTNTVLPNMKLGLDRRTGLSRFLTSWKSGNDPGTGEYSLKIDPVGSPQFFLYRKSDRLWRGGPWNGIGWSGMPWVKPNRVFNLTYVDNADEVAMMYGLHNASILSRIVVTESGTAQRLTWDEVDRRWFEAWHVPEDQCGNFGHCGAFGNCDAYSRAGEFECTCLPGFEPRSLPDWPLRDSFKGCVRKRGGRTCENGEGFVKLPQMKVPDTSIATRVDKSLGAKACKELCMSNCSCSGYTAANVSGAVTGCITWHGDMIDTKRLTDGGQDFFIRVDSIELAKYAKVSRSSNGKRVVAIVVASVAAMLFILCLAYMLSFLESGRKRHDELLFSPNTTSTTLGASSEGKGIDETGTNSDLPFYSLSIIAAATENFSIANKLGEGGFGLVYKGRLRNGQEIGVKRLSNSSRQGVEEFKNEVTLIAKLQHRNLVRLLGCCIQKEEKMLIYEYMPNKGLDSFIFDKEKGSLVDWRKRFEITLGIARGILYLHQDSRLRIIHRDLKASNVLLDAAMNPKISDFGMARIFGGDQIQANTNRVVGTYGYMSPEYAMEGLFSTKSDVFSFGVLLLEIISGRKNGSYYKENSINLIGHVWDLWKEGRALEVADPLLGESYQAHEVLRCIHIGILCVQELANDRPSMSEVALMLCQETTLPSPKQPAFIFKTANAGTDLSPACIEAVSVCDTIITVVEEQALPGTSMGSKEGFYVPFLSLFLFFHLGYSIDTITPTQFISDAKNESLLSSNGNFRLGFFSPRNSLNRYVGIWFNKVSEQTVVWVANRDAPLKNRDGVFKFAGDGNLAIFAAGNGSVPVWSSNVTMPTTRNLTARLLPLGNLALTATNGTGQPENVLWQSFDYPTDTILPGMKLGMDKRTGLNRVITSWKSDEDPGSGGFSATVEMNGSAQFFLYKNLARNWRCGPWNGQTLSGVPISVSTAETYEVDYATIAQILNFSFVNNVDEVYVTFKVPVNPSIYTRLLLEPMGTLQRRVWHTNSDNIQEWAQFWVAPQDRCDQYQRCGSSAICNSNNIEVECTCLPGFEQDSNQDWYTNCVEKKDLVQQTCGKGNGEGFTKFPNLKIPDARAARLFSNLSLQECETECLKSCNCTGYASSDVNNGGRGCFAWYGQLNDLRQYDKDGQDFYLRVAAAELVANTTRNSKGIRGTKKILIITLPIVAAALLFVCCSLYLWRVHAKKKDQREKRIHREMVLHDSTTMPNKDFPGANNRGESRNIELKFFDLETIITATDDFSAAKKIGQGGFGPVYKGQLSNGQQIAIKILSKNSGQGTAEFKNEALLIAKLQHRNLVKLLGCCIENEERILVYEYMPNKSLDYFIFDETKKSQLDWEKRHDIIVGIARGILYLHQDSRLKIIHRDLKASNILLDEELKPKISDFGTARIFQGDQTEANTTRVVGTFGYISPEYALDGLFSIKSDVFSFGVLLLEVISGKKNIGFFHNNPTSNLIKHAWELWNDGNALELVDTCMGDSYPTHDVLRCIQVGLLCVQDEATDRPNMSTIVFMLSNETTLPSPKQPLFSIQSDSNPRCFWICKMLLKAPQPFVLPDNWNDIIETYDIAAENGLWTQLNVWFLLFHLCNSADTITSTQFISDAKDESLLSSNGNFKLGFFSPGNSLNRYVGIWFNKVSEQTVVWVANREAPLKNRDGVFKVTGDGNIAVFSGNNDSIPLWSSSNVSMSTADNFTANLLPSGNLVLTVTSRLGQPETVVWQSFDYPTDTVLPGMKFGLDRKTGLNRVLTSWSSDDDPSPGDYTAGVELEGSAQFFLNKSLAPKWRCGPWNGQTLSGLTISRVVLSADTYDVEYSKIAGIMNFSFVNTNDEVYLTFQLPDDSIFTRFVLGQGGTVQRTVWLKDRANNEEWVQFWEAPQDRCDQYARCRTAALCNSNDIKVVCTCLPGFARESDQWNTNCVEKQKGVHACGKGNGEGFVNIPSLRIPDARNAILYANLSLQECEKECLKSCNCTGYASADVTNGGRGCFAWNGELEDMRQYDKDGQDFYLRVDAEELALYAISRNSCLEWKELGEDITIISSTFGPVHLVLGQGQLSSGQEIAVKSLSKTSGQGIIEFKNEALLIAKLQHRNLVRLLGCCIENEEKMLVYEYMPNKSLDYFIFDTSRKSLLDWKTRHGIIVGIARGILYLHQDSRLKIIHRDLKASNILLDEDLNPKISDFGTARIFRGNQSQANTSRVVGTFGYMSPEYALDGIFSEKSDVFSFGVLLLEVISGRKNIGFFRQDPDSNLMRYAWELWNSNRALELLDSSMGDAYPADEVMRCIQIGLLCVQDQAIDRPTMVSIVFMLCNEKALPSPKQPVFSIKTGQSNRSNVDSVSTGTKSSVNEESPISCEVCGTNAGSMIMQLTNVSLEQSDKVYVFQTDTINSTHFISDAANETLLSSNGNFKLGFFSPSNSPNRYVGMWFNKIPKQTVVWVANRDTPLKNNNGVFKITSDGNVAVFAGEEEGSVPIWSSNVSMPSLTHSTAKLLDGGNFVLNMTNGSGQPGTVLWQSFDHPTDTVLPGMRFGSDRRRGLNRVLTSWKVDDDPARGEFSFALDPRGSPQFFLYKMAAPLWRGGPWNGRTLSGLPIVASRLKTPEVDLSGEVGLFNYSFVSTTNGTYAIFAVPNVSIFSTLVLQPEGMLQRQIWRDDNKDWVKIWLVPQDRCDEYARCGPSAICNSFQAMQCRCLPGFEPQFPEDWYSKCVEKRKGHTCGKGKGEGFVKLTDLKVPDARRSRHYANLSLQECESECLKSCNCTGFASADINIGGRGCFLWYGDLTDIRVSTLDGQDFYLRVDAVELAANVRKDLNGSQDRKRAAIFIIVPTVSGVLLISCFCHSRRQHAKRKDETRKSLLNWKKRHEIIVGIARGMLYLHQDSRLRIIHRDLKASNILLDEELNPKISDFGTARIFGGNQNEANTSRVVGTFGYMSLEYALYGLFSVKSDVFSFGVLLLEIISGRKNTGFFQDDPTSNLIRHAWKLWSNGKSLEIVDASMGESWLAHDVLRCIQVGLMCVQDSAADRPTMSSVIFMLSNETNLPSPRQPMFAIQRSYSNLDLMTTGTSCSVNEVTVTMPDVR
ncbi:hypothetical protein RJ640_017538 [Escallonia rubra]|uniref:non-specific serine/threonine protein kinase n=1 Tax=Escallonia rubra TaxID=112253 RepID=A0AA88UBT7_9ASTE|nr:hypothetical protein RJ640_017538 [Escallonia rubra]